MRCLVCNAEMVLMKVVQDDTMPVPGFERRTFMCSACHDVEGRLVFVRPGQQSDAEPEASNRSRVMNLSPRSARDLFEASLNEAACALAGRLWALELRTGS